MTALPTKRATVSTLEKRDFVAGGGVSTRRVNPKAMEQADPGIWTLTATPVATTSPPRFVTGTIAPAIRRLEKLPSYKADHFLPLAGPLFKWATSS